MTEEKQHRLAIVRCDTHAYWFGVFMDEYDIDVLAAYDDDAPTREGVHYFFRPPGSSQKLDIQRVPGFVFSKVFDRIEEAGRENDGKPTLQYGSYPGRANEFSRTFVSRPTVCETLEEAAEDVDAAYIANSSSPTDGADHLELARPFLERSIPCFVDKPFATTLADAQEIIRLAKQNNTSVMSASILSHCDVGLQFKQRFNEIGDPRMLVVKGVGPANGAVIHGISAAHGLFGYGVESVHCTGAHPMEIMQLMYRDGREAIVINGPNSALTPTVSFFCSAYSNVAPGAIHSPAIDAHVMHTGTRRIVELFARMLATGQPPVPYEHLLEPIAIIEAARIAQETGKAVAIRDVWDGTAG